MKAFSNALRHTINTHIEQGCDEDKKNDLIHFVFGYCTVNEKPEGIDSQNAQNGRFTHHDFPAIKEKRKELAVDAW